MDGQGPGEGSRPRQTASLASRIATCANGSFAFGEPFVLALVGAADLGSREASPLLIETEHARRKRRLTDIRHGQNVMTKIINAARPVAIPGVPTDTPIADSLRSVGDSMYGYGARNEIKSQNMSREQTIAGAKVKATDALRRGDVTEFLAQSILADPTGSSAATFARAAGLIPNLPPIGAPPPPSTPQPANVAPQPGAVRPYRSPANTFDAPEANRPAKPPSVWDAAPAGSDPTVGGSTKLPPTDPYEVYRSMAGLPKKPANPLNAAGGYDPTQPGATY